MLKTYQIPAVQAYGSIPGVWIPRDTRFVWRPGFWRPFRPGYVWAPASYAWTPGGYVFVDGYWDYPLADRQSEKEAATGREAARESCALRRRNRGH